MDKIYKPTISQPQKGEWLPKLKCCKRNKQNSLSALLKINASEVPTSYLKKYQCSGYLVKQDDLLIFSLVLCFWPFSKKVFSRCLSKWTNGCTWWRWTLSWTAWLYFCTICCWCGGKHQARAPFESWRMFSRRRLPTCCGRLFRHSKMRINDLSPFAWWNPYGKKVSDWKSGDTHRKGMKSSLRYLSQGEYWTEVWRIFISLGWSFVARK